MKLQQRYLDFESISPLGWIRILCDLTGSGKIQDGGQKTSNAHIFASRQGNTQYITEIPTAKPTFFRSSIPLGLIRILCDKTGSGKIQDVGLLTSSACISASRRDINEIPTAISMFSGSSFPLGLVRILCDQTGSGNIRDGGLQTSNACISASRQDINELPIWHDSRKIIHDAIEETITSM